MAPTKTFSALALCLLFAGCGGTHQSPKPLVPVTKTPAIVLRITAPMSGVREDLPWPITVRAYDVPSAAPDARGALNQIAHVSGTISYAFLLRGAVVSRQPGGQMVDGTFHGSIYFPTSGSIPVVLRVSLTANGTTSTAAVSVYVTPSPQSLM